MLGCFPVQMKPFKVPHIQPYETFNEQCWLHIGMQNKQSEVEICSPKGTERDKNM